MVSAVILDLGGVIVDSESAWDEARRELAEQRGGTWPAVASEEVGRGKPAPDVNLEAARPHRELARGVPPADDLRDGRPARSMERVPRRRAACAGDRAPVYRRLRSYRLLGRL